jgi:hypothetical protein
MGLGSPCRGCWGPLKAARLGPQVAEMDERCSLLAGLAASELVNVVV